MSTELRDVSFPTVAAEGIPEDRDALCAILAGQRGLAKLYDALEAASAGESRFLVRLLRRDWARHVSELVPIGEDVLRSVGASGPECIETLPDAEQITVLSAEIGPSPPGRLVEFLREFGGRALMCYTLVPWKSDNPRVFEHFSACLLAEDAHLGTLDLFHTLVTESGLAGAP